MCDKVKTLLSDSSVGYNSVVCHRSGQQSSLSVFMRLSVDGLA